jgi:hypothetical protein
MAVVQFFTDEDVFGPVAEPHHQFRDPLREGDSVLFVFAACEDFNRIENRCRRWSMLALVIPTKVAKKSEHGLASQRTAATIATYSG